MSSLSGLPVDNSNISNLKDILLTYNRITEACFTKCVYTLNYRTMTPDEEECINNCSGKFVNGNQRIMQTFMQVQGQRQQAMVQEMEAKALQEQQQPQQIGKPTSGAITQTPGQALASQSLGQLNQSAQQAAKT